MGKNRRRKFLVFIGLFFLGAIFGSSLNFFVDTKIHVGCSYVFIKRGFTKEIYLYPKGKKVKGVESLIISNGMVFGVLSDNSYFYLEGSTVKYFDSYDNHIAFAHEKGVRIRESDYIKFL